CFREEPLRTDFPAVAVEESVAFFASDLIQAVSLGLGGMMFPQFHPRMRVVAKFGQEAQWRAVLFGWEHGASGEVNPHTDDIFSTDAAFLQNRRDGVLEY